MRFFIILLITASVLGQNVTLFADLGPNGAVLLSQAGNPFTCCDPQANERLGEVLAVGDFNGDGIDDLAIGIPGERGTIPPEHPNGMVIVVTGQFEGLGEAAASKSVLNLDGLNTSIQARLGEALAAGDFDGDGYDDLAIGIPGYDVLVGIADLRMAAGSVVVVYGTANGLGAESDLFRQGLNLSGTVESGDEVGAALAAGNFNGDEYDDLAIGVPFEDHTATTHAGLVHVLFGTADGLSTDGQQSWHQTVPDIPDATQAEELFGSDLVAGDITGDGYDELVVGVPGEDALGAADTDAVGAIHVIRGSASGPTAVDNQFLTADDLLAADSTFIGLDLTLLRFDADPYADLMKTARLRFPTIDPQYEAVSIHEGRATGLNADPFDSLAGYFTPSTEPHEFPTGALGLAEGEQSAALASRPHANIIYLSKDGDTFSFGTQYEPGDLGIAVNQDAEFGSTLASGDFDGDGFHDLAIGIPGKDFMPDARGVTIEAAGAVLVAFDQVGHSQVIRVIIEVEGQNEIAPRSFQLIGNCLPEPLVEEATGRSELLLFTDLEPVGCLYALTPGAAPGYMIETDPENLISLQVQTDSATLVRVTYVSDVLLTSGFEASGEIPAPK